MAQGFGFARGQTVLGGKLSGDVFNRGAGDGARRRSIAVAIGMAMAVVLGLVARRSVSEDEDGPEE